MLNTFIYKAIPNGNGTFKKELGELITRVNMPYTFKNGEPIEHDNGLWYILSNRYNVEQDAFIATVYKK